MQSIIKNAFDKVSVIKDVVGNSIEEAVKGNTRDASYVFNSGSSISTSIVSWVEKNNVSEKANNIKTSASLLVGDLATGLKGMTNNLSIQNSFVYETSKYRNKSHQERHEYDYFSGEFDTTDYIDGFYNDSYRSAQVIHNEEDTLRVIQNPEYETSNKIKNSLDPPIRSLDLSDDSSNTYVTFENSDTKFSGLNYDETICQKTENEDTFKNTESIRNDLIDLQNHSPTDLQGELICSNSEGMINHEGKDFYVNSETIEHTINASDIDDESIRSYKAQKHDCDFNNHSSQCSPNRLSFELPESSLEVNSETRNHKTDELEASLDHDKSSQLNPLSIFQKISKLEEQNNSLKVELEQIKNESTELKEKINLKTKIINSINSRLSKLEIEKKSLNSYISELENSQVQFKTKIDELEHINMNLKLNEDINKEHFNTIKSLQEKILELEDSLTIGEASKVESLKTYQNEISELRLELSNFKEKESNISKPYIARISILEHQLGELRKRHSSELQRFETIMNDLKKKSAKDRSENEILGGKIEEMNRVHQEMTEKYEFRISQYKNIVDHIESNKISNSRLIKSLDGVIKGYKLSVCNVNKLVIEDKSFNVEKVSYNPHLSACLKQSVLSKSNNLSRLSILNPLQEEIKQALHDKQLLEDEYFTVCEKNKQIGQELVEEKQRNKLLQQQLDTMFKLINDLNSKLNESKRS